MAGAVQRLELRRALIVMFSAGWLVVGLIGLYGYWQSYYLHRGFAPVVRLPRAGIGRRLVVNFFSPALGREADYRVYLPPHYDPAHHRYPVFYMLHGSPGRPQVYVAIAHIDVRLANLISRHRARPMILVFPDGRIGGSTYSDSEWANTPSGNYMSYVIDVVHDVDQRFATIPSRPGRVIAGFSAGAYGALNITLHELPVFGALQVWSGYFVQTRSGVFANATPAQLRANSPLEYVSGRRGELALYPLRAFLFVGRGDHSGRGVAAMAGAMRAAGADVGYAIYQGGHDWQLWNGRVDQMLELASRMVSAP